MPSSPQSEGDNTSKHFMCIYLYCFVVKDSLRNTNTIYFTFRKSMIWSCYSLKFSMMAIVILTFVAQKSQYLNWRSEYQLNLQVALIRSCGKKVFFTDLHISDNQSKFNTRQVTWVNTKCSLLINGSPPTHTHTHTTQVQLTDNTFIFTVVVIDTLATTDGE